MRKPLLATLLALVALSAAAPLAFAEGGDASAVIQICGVPGSEHQGVSQVTNRMERDLSYGKLILHFQPAQNGWSFLSAWDDHVPMTQRMLENRLPCFKEAMEYSAAHPNEGTYAIDPTIRAQTAALPADTSTFGIPHLWLIIVLFVLVILVYFLVPAAKRRPLRAHEVERMRQRRKPDVERHISSGSIRVVK